MRLALIGTGDAAQHHARALLELTREGQVRWTALTGRDADRRAQFRSRLGVPSDVQDFGSLEEVLAARVADAVILATPDAVHADQVCLAAQAGLHVLVEKPLALTRAEGQRAVETAQKAGVHLRVGYQLRHHPAHRWMKSQLPGRVGTLRSLFVRWAWPDPALDGWRARGELARFWSLSALGTHAFDLALWLTGAEPSDVRALREPPQGVDRAAEVSLRLGATLAHVSVSVQYRASSRVLASGDAGELEAIGTLGARGDGELWARLPRQPPEAISFSPHNPYVAQLRAFVEDTASPAVRDLSLWHNLTILDRIGAQESETP